MKKLKYAFWLIFIGFFALLIYQNLEFFSTMYSLKIDLGFYQRQTPEMTTGAIMASFVGISVLIMIVFYLTSRFENFRAKKTIKTLTHALDESKQIISGLKSDQSEPSQTDTDPSAEPVAEAEAPSDASDSDGDAAVNPAKSA